jgi:hypothetical protein
MTWKTQRRLGLLLLALLVANGLPAVAGAAAWRVTPEGDGDAPTIQAAIAAAAPGDTIWLAAGTFRGAGNRDLDLQGKALLLQSEAGDPTACLIDCEGSAADPHRGLLFLSAEPAGCRIVGITITNGHAGGPLGPSGGAILMTEDAEPVLENCWLLGNEAVSGGGLYLDRARPTLRQCWIAGNRATVGGGGIACQNNAWPLFESCLLTHNHADVGGGLFCEWSLPTLRACTLVFNEAAIGGGVGAYSASTAILEATIIAYSLHGAAVACENGGALLTCCDLYGNSGGDWSGCVAAQAEENGNFGLDPRFCDPEGGDFHLHADSPCAPEVAADCGLIGALGVACGPTGTLVDSWGDLKARFREAPTW